MLSRQSSSRCAGRRRRRGDFDAAPRKLTILSADQSQTTISATLNDPDGDVLTYHWLLDGAAVDGPHLSGDGVVTLELGALSPLAVGAHTFELVVSDDVATVTANVVVTVDNSPPEVAPDGGGVVAFGADVVLGGMVSDYDGDVLTYTWTVGEIELVTGTITAPAAGVPLALDDFTIAAATLGLGTHTLELRVSDGVNAEVVSSVSLSVTDDTAPLMTPLASTTILWPANHTMREVVIYPNAVDNTGGPVELAVKVASSEPPEFEGDGSFLPDHEVVEVSSADGVIRLNLRAERSGKGAGRTYTVTITATDASQNASTATVTVVCPHDKRGK